MELVLIKIILWSLGYLFFWLNGVVRVFFVDCRLLVYMIGFYVLRFCFCFFNVVGCNDGLCIIWDFDIWGVVKEFCEKDCVFFIISVSWLKCGYCFFFVVIDKILLLWDVGKGVKIGIVIL